MKVEITNFEEIGKYEYINNFIKELELETTYKKLFGVDYDSPSSTLPSEEVIWLRLLETMCSETVKYIMNDTGCDYIYIYKITLAFIKDDKKGIIVPYQLCPKCNGDGKIEYRYGGSFICDVCNGNKIIPQCII